MKLYILAVVACLAALSGQSQLPWQQVYNGSYQSRPYCMGASADGYIYAFTHDLSNKPVMLRSNANGDQGSWTAITLPPDLTNVVDASLSSASDGSDVYIVSSTMIWHSGDRGTTWQKLSNVPIQAVKYANFDFLPWGNVMLSRAPSGLFRSTDKGQTWTTVLNADISKVIHRHAEIYAFNNTSIYKSTDLGATWINLNAVMPTAEWKHVSLLSNDSFVIVHNDTVFVSSDAITWVKKNSTGLHNEPCGIFDFVKAPKSDSLFILRAESTNMDAELLCSPDGGATWINFQTGMALVGNPYIIDLYVSVQGYLFASGYPGHIYRISNPFALSVAKTRTNSINANVHPNPASDHLYIDGSEVGVKATLLNTLGQNVFNRTLKSNKEMIDVSQLAPGSYMLKLTGSNGARTVVNVQKL